MAALQRILGKVAERLRQQRGFTLAELLVVVAILAVLAAFTFPAVAGTKDTAKSGGDKTDKDSVTKAIGRFQGDFQIDTAYNGAGTTSLAAGSIVANYTQATARYGLPLGCYIPSTIAGSRPVLTDPPPNLSKQTLCGAFANESALRTAVYTGAATLDEVYMLDLEARNRIRLKDGTVSLKEKRFVPDYLPKFPSSIARPSTGVKNSNGCGPNVSVALVSTDPHFGLDCPLVANDTYTGDNDTRWVVRLQKGLLGTEASSSEIPFKVEVWKIATTDGAVVWTQVKD